MNLRGLLTSLGAGGSLIGAALCAFAIVGAMIAVRDDDDAAAAKGGDVVLPAGVAGQRADGTARVRRRVVVSPAATPRRSGALPPSRRGTVEIAAPRETAPSVPVAPVAPVVSPAASAPPAVEPSPPAAEPTPVPPISVRRAVAPVVEAAPEPVAEVVERVVEPVDRVLEPVSELLPNVNPAG